MASSTTWHEVRGVLAWRAHLYAVWHWNITCIPSKASLFLDKWNIVRQIYIPMYCREIHNGNVRLERVLYSSGKRHTLLSVCGSAFNSAVRNSFGFRFGIQFRSNRPWRLGSDYNSLTGHWRSSSHTVWDTLGVPIGVSTFTDTGTLGVSPDAKTFHIGTRPPNRLL